MSKHYSHCPTKFTLQFASAHKATIHGRQLRSPTCSKSLTSSAACKRRLRWIRARIPNKGYELCIYVFEVLFSPTSGGCTQTAVEELDRDCTLKADIGIRKIPEQFTVSE